MTLLDDAYAPITSSVGFILSPIETVAQVLSDWRIRLYGQGKVSRIQLDRQFPDALHSLEPLTGGTPPRELIISTDSPWTAYFDCFIQGPDPAPPIGHLAEVLQCTALTVRNVPHTWSKAHSGRFGSVQFQLFGPNGFGYLNYIRTVEATHDGSKWVFHESGTPQIYEELSRYSARSIPDRFPPELLDTYCRALGVRYFDPTFYTSDSVLIESQIPLAHGAHVMNLNDAQRWLGIRRAASLN
jgi:hypothetical protein